MLDLSHVNALISPSAVPLPPINSPVNPPRRTQSVAPHAWAPHTPYGSMGASISSTSPQKSGLVGASPRARRVGYAVDMASQKLYMASLNKNRFRASLSFEEFEAGIQEALGKHAQMSEARFEAMRQEQDDKEQQLELALARLARAEETIAMLSDRVADEEVAHADTTADAQSRVALFAQQTAEMASMMGRLRERLGEEGDGSAANGPSVGFATTGSLAVDIDAACDAVDAVEREQAARVAATASKLEAMTDLVESLTDSLLGGAEPLQSSGDFAFDGTGSPEVRVVAASDRLGELEALVARMSGAVRLENCESCPTPLLTGMFQSSPPRSGLLAASSKTNSCCAPGVSLCSGHICGGRGRV